MKYIVVHRMDYLREDKRMEIISQFTPCFEKEQIQDVIFVEGSDRFSFEVFDTSFIVAHGTIYDRN